MHEDLLHFVWKYQKIPFKNLTTTSGQRLTIISPGDHNHHSGPDFLNARIRLGRQLWVGNVEIHLKSSDWYAHGHERDKKYRNVILHAVWQEDMAVFRSDNTILPTLELKGLIPKLLLENYSKLFAYRIGRFINCQNNLSGVDNFKKSAWLQRLYLQRLEHKTILVGQLLKELKNDWESVCYMLLFKNFGSAVNGEAFYELSRTVNYAIVRKFFDKPLQLESLFFGTARLLEPPVEEDGYYRELYREYVYLKKKFDLGGIAKAPEFFGLRPNNFPTLRISQFAHLYSSKTNIFSQLIEGKNPAEYYEIFRVEAGVYWDSHYSFGKSSRAFKKKLSRQFIDLLIINTVVPLKFSFAKYQGQGVNEEIFELLSQIRSERNSLLNSFKSYGLNIKNAADSQAVLELYQEYCKRNRCLQCAIGVQILSGK